MIMVIVCADIDKSFIVVNPEILASSQVSHI